MRVHLRVQVCLTFVSGTMTEVFVSLQRSSLLRTAFRKVLDDCELMNGLVSSALVFSHFVGHVDAEWRKRLGCISRRKHHERDEDRGRERGARRGGSRER
jgi:hypothetical protein